MKTRALLPAVAVLACLPAPGVSRAADEPAKDAGRKVVAYASATVYAKPDAARLTFALATEAAAKAREENDKQVKKVKDGLATLAFPNLEVRVVPLAVNTVPTPAIAGAMPAGTTKQAQTVFVVTVREKNPEKLKEMATKLADVAEEGGGVALAAEDSFRAVRAIGIGMGGVPETKQGPRIEWLSENAGDARREAIKRAVAEARASAQAAVGDAPLRVVEVQVWGRENFLTGIRLHDDEPATASLGQVPTTVNVQVTYSY
jgi:uncharacterized protein YggE